MSYTKDKMVIAVADDVSGVIPYQDVTDVEIRLNDGRTISNDQRAKAYATIRDIADYTGHSPEYLKEWFKFDYLSKTGGEYFSLSDCTVSVARAYINHLIEFCIRYGVPIYHESLINRTDDIDKYLYYCLLYKKCALCRIHHTEAHVREREFFERNHLYGIKLDARLCEKLELKE